MQVNKNIKIFINYFLGPILFTWLAYSIYRQISQQPKLEVSWNIVKQSFQSYRISYLGISILFIILNWGLEAWKWKLALSGVYKISLIQSFKAILAGVSFSVTMPNRVGEYFGRMMFLPEGSRLKTISVTLVASFSQLLVTIIMGTLGLLFLKGSILRAFPTFTITYQFIIYGLTIMLFLLSLVYFNVVGSIELFKRWIRNERYLYLVEALNNLSAGLLLKLLAVSFLRYMVFIIQYVFIFYLFGVMVTPSTIFIVISVVFLAMAVIPSIALVEVGLRGEISIKLLGIFTSNTLGIGLTSVTIWFINLILPAIIGSILILNLKVFKKRNESL